MPGTPNDLSKDDQRCSIKILKPKCLEIRGLVSGFSTLISKFGVCTNAINRRGTASHGCQERFFLLVVRTRRSR